MARAHTLSDPVFHDAVVVGRPIPMRSVGATVTPFYPTLTDDCLLLWQLTDAAPLITPANTMPDALQDRQRAIGGQMIALAEEVRFTSYRLDHARRQASAPAGLVEGLRSCHTMWPAGPQYQPGLPYLEWTGHSRETPAESRTGWALRLSGAPDILSFADWTDAAGIESLVAMLQDPEYVTSLSGIVNPSESAAVARLQDITALKGDRRLACPQYATVRKHLARAHLCAPDQYEGSASDGFRVRLSQPFLSASRTRPVPVATLISTAFDHQGRPALVTDGVLRHRAEAAQHWTDHAQAVLVAAGYTILPRTFFPECRGGLTGFAVTSAAEALWKERIGPLQERITDLSDYPGARRELNHSGWIDATTHDDTCIAP